MFKLGIIDYSGVLGPFNGHPTLATNIQAYWKLEDNTDEVASNNWTFNGNTTVTGKIGDGQDYDGINDCSEVNTNDYKNTTNGSISFWYNPDVIPSGSSNVDIVGKYQTNDTGLGPYYGWQIGTYDSAIWFSFKSSSGADLTTLISGAVSTGTWQHIVITWDGTNVKLFVNKILRGITSYVTPVWDTNMQYRIGCWESLGTSSRFYNGKLDEKGVWGKALSDGGVTTIGNTATGEVSDLYNSGSGLQY